MTTLYKPVKIESAEQAEALPVGTTVTHPDYWPREKGNLLGSWEGPGDAMQNAEMVGWTALVPIEAEEETSVVVSAPGSRDIDSHPYSEANMDSDGNVWFGEGHRRVDVTEQFNVWTKQHTRTRFVTPWEEVSDKP